MKSRSAGERRKKVVPTRLPTVGLRDDPTVYTTVECRREDRGELLVAVSNIPEDLSSSGQLGNPAALALLWFVPANIDGRGNILSLNNATVELHNEGPYEVFLDAAQPYGYASYPFYCSGWKPITNGRISLPAGASTQFTITLGGDSVSVPHRMLEDTREAIHLVSVAMDRSHEPRSGYVPGADANKSQVGLRLTAKVRYESGGSSNSVNDFFVARYYGDATHLYTVSTLPPTVLSGSLINGKLHLDHTRQVPASIMTVERQGSGTDAIVQFKDAKGNLLDGCLPPNILFTCNIPLPGSYTVGSTSVALPCSIIKRVDDAIYIFHSDPNIRGKYFISVKYPVEVIELRPSTPPGAVFRLRRAKIGTLRGDRRIEGGVLTAGKWYDKFFQAASVVISVVRVSSAVLGALGLMAPRTVLSDEVQALAEGSAEQSDDAQCDKDWEAVPSEALAEHCA